ncbi:MAG: SDR family oxidoreductase [Proteobacteria bacterium]|nr:SDR family oxidoreductase [Pseudomonadota bacterium]
MTERILIAGATGYLGRFLVRQAHERGWWVRALVRRAEGLGDEADCCDDIFVGQATEDETLEELCDGVDVVISSLGNRTTRRKPTPMEVDYAANMNIVRKAERAGVKHFVFVSVLKGDQMRRRVPQIEARELVVDELKTSDMASTIIRPSGFFNDMSEFLDMARNGGALWIPGAGNTSFNPIHGADLAAFTLDHAGQEASFGGDFSVGGPDIFTVRELGELACDVVGCKPRFRRFPAWAMMGAAAVLAPFNANLASLIGMIGSLISEDAATVQFGTHHLRDFFQEIVETETDQLKIQRGK